MDRQRQDQVRAGLLRLHVTLCGDAASVLDEVTVARHLNLEAGAAFSFQVRAARGAGHSWDRIAEYVPGFPASFGPNAGEGLFEFLTEPASRGGAQAIYWRCGDCAGLVGDHGPYGGHPADVEQGHADGCGRFQDAVDRYMIDRLRTPDLGSNRNGKTGRQASVDLDLDLGLG